MSEYKIPQYVQRGHARDSLRQSQNLTKSATAR